MCVLFHENNTIKSNRQHAENKSFGIFNRRKRTGYSVSDIAEGAGIGRTTLFRIWDDFVELGIVKPTRVIGNAKLYKVNLENAFVKKMVDLFDTLVIEPLNKKRKVVVRH